MAIRYADTPDAAAEGRDFAVRERKPALSYLAMGLAAVCLLAIGITISIESKTALCILLALLLAATGGYVIWQLQRHRDLVLATEFQNALFASALGLNHKFCVIIKRDGAVIYLDRSFQAMFPDFTSRARRTIGSLLSHARVPQGDAQKVFDAIERGIYDRAIFNVQDSQGKFHHIVMTVEPILRPSGFILLRGREYIERKTAETVRDTTNASSHNPTITLFSHVMDSMHIGIYMTSPDGHLIYVNPLLEGWLGFAEGEMASGTLMLGDMVYQNEDATAAEPRDYEGVTLLRRKNGASLQVFVNQKIIRDERGKPLGCTALVNHIGATAAELPREVASGF